jgi:hypothetical protein
MRSFKNYHSGDQIKYNEMVGAYVHIGLWYENLREEDRLGDLAVDGRTILM